MAEHYRRAGYRIAAARWRGRGGEIDIVARKDGYVIFIEVKRADTHGEAAERLLPRQIARLFAAGSEYIAGEPRGQDSNVRFDVATVDGAGRIAVIENALCP